MSNLFEVSNYNIAAICYINTFKISYIFDRLVLQKTRRGKYPFYFTKFFLLQKYSTNLDHIKFYFWSLVSHVSLNEPPRDRTNKMACAPSEDSEPPRDKTKYLSFSNTSNVYHIKSIGLFFASFTFYGL